MPEVHPEINMHTQCHSLKIGADRCAEGLEFYVFLFHDAKRFPGHIRGGKEIRRAENLSIIVIMSFYAAGGRLLDHGRHGQGY